MTRQEEADFIRKADAEFRAHRPLPFGRNFTCWETTYGNKERKAYRDNYDQTFQPQTKIGKMLAEMDQ